VTGQQPQKKGRNQHRNAGKPLEGKIEPQVDTITNLVLQRVEQHLHLPIRMRDNAELAEMRGEGARGVRRVPADDRGACSVDAHVDRSAFDYPFKLARRGQAFGIAALVAVLIFCGYLASLGTTGQVIGGIIATIDLVAIIATLMGSNTGRDPPLRAQRRARRCRS
jgi:hypothetical protein